MEVTRGSYKNKRGDVYITEDGHKYTLSKDRESIRYLICILFREKCPSTAKLNKLTNIITISWNGGKFVAWVTLFSFFPSLNASKNVSVVLFNPFYYIIRNIFYKTAYISIKPCIPFSFPSRRPCDELSMRRMFRDKSS